MDESVPTAAAGTSFLNRKRRCFENDDDSNDEPAAKVHIEEKSCTLLSCCDEILIEILKYLDGNTLNALGKTCYRLYGLITDHRLWHNIDLTSESLALQEIYRRLKFMDSATSRISLRGLTESYPKETWNNVTISEELLKRISESCQSIETLEIHQGFMNLEKIAITDFPCSLKKLVFDKCFVKFPSKTQAHGFFTRIDLHFEHLEELILENCNWFETHDLVLFSKIRNLKKLSLRGCESLKECVPYGSISTRFGFRKLEVLDVRDTPISDSDIQCFNITLTLKTLLLECPEDLRDPNANRAPNQSQSCSFVRHRASTRRIMNNSSDRARQNDDGNLFHIVVNDYSFINVNLPRGNNSRPNVEVYLVNPERPQAAAAAAVVQNDQQPQPQQLELPQPQQLELPQPQQQRVAQLPNPNQAIARSLWFERRYPPPFSPPRIYPISDRGICSFGSPRNPVQDGLVWIRAEARPPDTHLEKIVVRHYKLVTDMSLCHLALCTPSLVHLDLTGTSVTREGIENFKQQKPHCFIISDHFTG